MIVGFAAETGDPGRDVLTLGRDKLARKGCDLLVVNDVGVGPGLRQPDNEVVILGADGARDGGAAQRQGGRRRRGLGRRRAHPGLGDTPVT